MATKQTKADLIKKMYSKGIKFNPVFKKPDEFPIKFARWQLALILVLIIIISASVFLIKNRLNDLSRSWYAVKLVDNEIYFGQIDNIRDNPITLKKVYYFHDQDRENGDKAILNLVKRGKEAHGPSGIMHITREQILYIELLKESSKVIAAILEYEK